MPADDPLERALSAPIDDLVVADVRVDFPAAASWDLPAADRDALTGWGLPRLDALRVVLTPDAETVVLDGQRAYPLARLHGDARVVAISGSGLVIGIREKTEIPAVIGPELSRTFAVNSTTALFVEWSWRWHWIRLALLAEPDQDEALFDKLDLVAERIRAADPGVGDNSADSLWLGRIEGW